MKKSFTALLATFYLYSFTLCLCYAAATGEVHPGVRAGLPALPQATSEHQQGECHHHDPKGEAGQDHHGQNTPDACCIKLFQDVSGLLAGTSARVQPALSNAWHLLPISAFALDTWQRPFLYRNHNPPGPDPQGPFLSALGSRAPPAV
jgi:hypothetical protein